VLAFSSCVLPSCRIAPLPPSPMATVDIPFDLGAQAASGVELQFHEGLVVAIPGDTLRCHAQVDVSAATEEICQQIVEALAPTVHPDPATGILHLDLGRPESAPMDAVHVSYYLEVPASVALRVQTSQGQVNLRGLAGDVAVITDAGSIRARLAGGTADLRSRTGTVRLSGAYRKAYLESGVGAVDAALPMMSPPVDVEVRTVTGPVVIEVADDLAIDLTYDGAVADLRTDLPVVWNTRDAVRSGRLGGRNTTGTARVRILSAGAKVEFASRRSVGG